MWLFNDILVWGDDGKSSINVHGYISISTVPRVQLDDVASAATGTSFVLPSSEAELHLVAPNVEERGVWVNAIMRAVRPCTMLALLFVLYRASAISHHLTAFPLACF